MELEAMQPTTRLWLWRPALQAALRAREMKMVLTNIRASHEVDRLAPGILSVIQDMGYKPPAKGDGAPARPTWRPGVFLACKRCGHSFERPHGHRSQALFCDDCKRY